MNIVQVVEAAARRALAAERAQQQAIQTAHKQVARTTAADDNGPSTSGKTALPAYVPVIPKLHSNAS